MQSAERFYCFLQHWLLSCDYSGINGHK